MEDLLSRMSLEKDINLLPYGGRPKYVKFAPNDRGEHLPTVFFEGWMISKTMEYGILIQIFDRY